jgi:hypothetical protein
MNPAPLSFSSLTYSSDGGTTDSQLFPFTAGQKTIVLAPENSKGAVCLAPKGALLDQATCSGAASQVFSIV